MARAPSFTPKSSTLTDRPHCCCSQRMFCVWLSLRAAMHTGSHLPSYSSSKFPEHLDMVVLILALTLPTTKWCKYRAPCYKWHLFILLKQKKTNLGQSTSLSYNHLKEHYVFSTKETELYWLIFYAKTNLVNNLSSFPWLNKLIKETGLKGQHSFILYYWQTLPPCGPYFPLRTACLCANGKIYYYLI